jgi:hypothetical protein
MHIAVINNYNPRLWYFKAEDPWPFRQRLVDLTIQEVFQHTTESYLWFNFSAIIKTRSTPNKRFCFEIQKF